MSPVDFPAPRVPLALRSVLLGSALLVVAACGGQKPIDEVEPYMVKGVVGDPSGKPLANVAVHAHNTLQNFSYVTGVSDENGEYRIALDPDLVTSYWVRSSLMVDWDNQRWTIPLVPNDTTPFPAAGGAVRNLDWMLSGQVTGLNIGGTVYVDYEWGEEFTDFPRLEIRLEPIGTLIDGSEGETITANAQAKRWSSVPVGRYRVTARHTGDVPQPLKVRIRYSDDPFVEVLETGFENHDGYADLKIEVTAN